MLQCAIRVLNRNRITLTTIGRVEEKKSGQNVWSVWFDNSGFVQDCFRPEHITLVQNWFRDRTVPAGLLSVKVLSVICPKK